MSERNICISRGYLGKAGLYLLFAILPSLLLAAEWTAKPTLSVFQSYNDNIRLTTLVHPNVTTTTVKPTIDLGWATERANVDLYGEWKHNQYAGDPNLENRTDRKYDLKSGYKTERSQFSLNAGYVKDTTLSQDGFIEDIGATLAQLNRKTKSVTPSWSWNVTERTNLRLDLRYQDVAYEKSLISPYNDYLYDSAGLTYSFQWTRRDQVYVVLNQSRYDSKKRSFIPDNEMVVSSRFLGSDSNTFMYQFGINHQVNSTFKIGAGYGSRDSNSQTQYQQCTGFGIINGNLICINSIEIKSDSKSKAPVYSLSADKDFELTKLGAKLSRTVTGSGLGSEMEVDSFDVNFDRRLTEKWRLKFSFLANQRVAVNPDFSRNDRKFLRGDVSLGWKLDRNWNLYASYRYTRQKYETTDAVANANNVSLNIKYSWDRISKSW